jgi:hypothetical protein
VIVALERIGDDPQARFRFFRRLLAVAQKAAGEAAQVRDRPQ